MNQPNVIYLVAHDLGKETSAYGSPFRTPNFDRFAAGGVLFTDAVCSSPCCSPSRGCAMTGMTAHNNGLAGLANPGWDWALPQSVRTVVDDFNDAGYETVHSGMQHERQNKNDNHYQKVLPSSGWVESAVDGAIDFLKQRREGDRPFYLNIGTNEVHSGQWQTNKPDRQHTRNIDLYGSVDPESLALPHYLPDLPQVRKEWAAFAGCVEYWDSQVGRLLATLEELGTYKDTIVILTTDHGVATHRGKGTLYREGIEISLAVRAPGMTDPGRKCDDLIANIDVLPTLLEACNIAVRPEIQGHSFLPRLTGSDYAPNSHIFVERNFHTDFDPMRSIRTKDFVLIENFDPSREYCYLPGEIPQMNESYAHWFTGLWPKGTIPRPRWELFDRRSDPDEFRNVADDPAHGALVSDLRELLHAWMRETRDPLLEIESDESESFKAILKSRFR